MYNIVRNSYHSSFNAQKQNQKTICGINILPIRTNFKGPAQIIQTEDIIDESLSQFQTNVYLKQYQPQGSGDIFLIFLTLYISSCLRLIQKIEDPIQAIEFLQQYSNTEVNITNSYMKGLIKRSKNAKNNIILQQYLQQLKKEVVQRLINIIFQDGKQSKNYKVWMGYSKLNFLDLIYKDN